MLVVWRNDAGNPVPIGGHAMGEQPKDVELALDRGLITFGYTTSSPAEEDRPEQRSTEKVFLRLRGPALAEVADPNAAPLDLGPFAISRGGHSRTLTMEPDGTWTYRARSYADPPQPYYRETTGRVIARNGNTATVRLDATGRTETWTYDEANDMVQTGSLAAVCGPRSPIGWCGA